ncbi:MAG: hypothetical protein H7062_22145 [Candidatus Saccharimonas sp.]|nr:hypothetical protein [Planctomycetaceae bacterium]
MNSNTLLLRQVHPSFVQQGRVTSQAFRPTPKDEQKLSMYDGDQIAPQPAHRHYTETLGCASIGVLGVTVAECTGLNLPAIADPKPFPEHVVLDYSSFPKHVIETKAKLLKVKAENRGWLFESARAT